VVARFEAEDVQTRIGTTHVVEDVFGGRDPLMNFENVLPCQGHIRIDNVGIVGGEPPPPTLGNSPLGTWYDEAETAAPAGVAIGKNAIQLKLMVLARVDEKGDTDRPGPDPSRQRPGTLLRL
jgi:hypothetical protein